MTTTEFRLFPKALVLTNTHHFAGTDIMARSLAAGLEANGFDTSIANVYDKDSQAMVQALLDPETALIITTGTLPLLVRINDQPIWRAIPDHRSSSPTSSTSGPTTTCGSSLSASSWRTGRRRPPTCTSRASNTTTRN
ncbi:MAG: hypothetical protein IPK20_05550 [Betaproteobacteria bacterium]|nr:hypothetical protein [Betaproteobacteria bacterium]